MFRRIPVEDEAYLAELVYYIHANPEKHGFTTDFRTYPHSSYQAHLSVLETKLNRQQVLAWFGDIKDYEHFHIPHLVLEHLDKFEIEFDK